MSYTIDVYRGELHARRSLLDLAVFVSFFPHLVAGPIQRASFLLPQVESPRRFSAEKARSGFVLICWGFFKKLVIADNVGVIANKVFALSDPTFYILWAGVFAFAIQIYADFSAYTDIARGTSRWLGFELTENFAHPVPGAQPGGLLAALEHLALELVPRLRLHPARRLALRRVAVGAQRARHVPALGPVARRELELRALGALPRPAPARHAGGGTDAAVPAASTSDGGCSSRRSPGCSC